ncbi:MAG: hypothetical protein CVV22_04465 [Ignavibacteriae bacterium HGW-Ignavibacteriae-1]|jgi:hypothetical protein|nr:MAG: hypothetical protein CVV22_04465 [Ignavibacteriae bacterium HGW-Ignavibacteriae-1]
MDLAERKLELIDWVSKTKSNTLLELLEIIKDSNSFSDEWWDNATDAEKQSIKKGLDDLDNGNLKPHSEARRVYEKWL